MPVSSPPEPYEDALDLNALIGSRICHDLISPLGAIGNGVELLALSGIEKSPEIALIAQSVDSANARIRFFRVAFGAAGPEQSIGAAEIAAILDAVSQAGKHRLDWVASEPVSRPVAKLAFLLILCAECAMPWGGRISVLRVDERWRVEGFAERTRIDAGHWDILAELASAPHVTSSNVEFPLAMLYARSLGRRVVSELSETRVTVTF